MVFSLSTKQLATALRIIWIVTLCIALGVIFWLNALEPSFVYRDMNELYIDGHYIASVAKNIAEGHGVSYWNGISYRFLDPEISTGPVVFLPMAAALWAGVDEIIVFSASPIIVNLILLALLLSKVSKLIPSLRVFMIFSAAVCVASLCFQRWQWYLPLGEVPAALLLLLTVLSISDAAKRNALSGYGCAGVVLGLAILSKMVIILTVPVFIAVIFLNEKNRPQSIAIPVVTMGVLLIFSLYAVICVALSPGIGVGELLRSAYGYFVFNFNFGIVDGIFPLYVNEKSFFENVFFYIEENFFRGALVDDPIGYMKLALIYSSLFLMAAIGISLPRDKKVLVFSAIASALVLCAWYFAANLHNARYIFIVGYTGIFFLGLFTALTDVGVNRQALIIGFGALGFALLGRSVVFRPVTDFSLRTNVKDVSDFLADASISEVLGSATLVNGYPKIAFYLGGDVRYLRALGYLRRHAEFNSNLPDCDISSEDLLSAPSPLNDPLLYCFFKKEKSVPISFRWKDNDLGYFLKKLEKWEVGDYKPECGSVVYQNTRYILMRCSKKELAKVIERQTEGRFFMSQ